MAEKEGDPAPNSWISAPWRRKSENAAQNPATEVSSKEEPGRAGAKSWGDMIPALAPTSWIKGDTSKVAGSDQPSDVKQEEDSNSQGKTWGDIIYPALKPATWRRKSQDEAECSELAQEVLQEEPMGKDEPCAEKLKEKCENSKESSHVPAKTWGEMIHPALSWRGKSKDEAGTSEVVPADEIDDELKETSDDVPRAAEGTLTAVAASIKRSIAGMSRWSMGDLTLGLYKLSGRHALEGVADTIDGSRVTSSEELEEIFHWFQWAFAAYKKNKEKLAAEIQIEEEQIVKHVFTSAVLKPAYFIAVDDARRCVVISIRGTLAATDVLTDLNPHSEKFEGGYAHSGMLAAARWLMENEADNLRDLLAANPEYRFVLVGHSLGAGTAALLCMLLRDYDEGSSRLGIPPSWITCWGYGCPPCVDKRLAEEARFIKNTVLQDDVVARISPGALEELRAEILETDWSHAFKDGSKGKRMLELAQATLPGVAKYGHAAFVVAKSGALAGTRIHKAANWFTVGIAAAELLRSASSYRGVPTAENGDENEIENEGEAAAATLAATVAQTMKDPKESLETERLYVPGILYHILRKPLNPETVMASVLPAQAEASKDGEGTGKSAAKSVKAKAKQPQFQHIVVRGDDPGSRFKRIVLSSTLLSDHGCYQYKESLSDAISWLQHEP